jgi:hypothetical protein
MPWSWGHASPRSERLAQGRTSAFGLKAQVVWWISGLAFHRASAVVRSFWRLAR